MTQWSFWRQRMLSLIALGGTLAALITLVTRASMDSQLLAEYGVVQETIVWVFLALLLPLVLLMVCEPVIRGWLRRHRAGRVLIPIAGLISVGAVLLSGSDQTARLFRYPLSLWVIIVYIVGLCILLVLLTLDNLPETMPASTFRRVEGWALVVMAVLLILAFIISVGEFMPLDLPDEPWLGSMATNFALNNDLSPSYLASAYGSPDPVLGRYYWVMGWWLRLVNNTTLVSLRLFPLIIASLAVIITLLALRRAAQLPWPQVLVGLVVLLGLSAFVRSSHNLRNDIGLAVYGALALWGQIAFFHSRRLQKRWLVLTGLALYCGLETVPTIALLYAGSIGLMLVVWWLRQPRRLFNIRYMLVYGIAVAVSGGLYFAGHFLPDVQANWVHYQAFSSVYTSVTSLGSLRDPWPVLADYFMRFNMILSPAELLIVLPALVLFWRRFPSDRWLVGAMGLTLVLALLFIPPSYGYLALFAPLVAYAVASVWQSRTLFTLGISVLLPALVALPVYDLTAATQQHHNAEAIAQTTPLLEEIPEGSIVVGEPLFWFSLHPNRQFIGWTGVSRLVRLYGIPFEQVLDNLEVDVTICWSGYEDRCNRITAQGAFSEPSAFVVNGETYWISWRLDSPESGD
ncbi:MAG: hypothetical protein H6672_20435 [Anaerolineaceae bacterium]|nr:hypothetical protein [Anaerolineaceae bacterium]